MTLARSARWRSSSSRRTRLPGEAGMTEYSMLDVGDRLNGDVLRPPCFLGMGRATVWNVGDVLEVSRCVIVWVSSSVEGMDFPIARVGLGGGESVDLKLRLSKGEWLTRIPAIPGVSSMSSVMLSDKTGRAIDDAKLPLRCRCCFSFRSGVGAVVEKAGM